MILNNVMIFNLYDENGNMKSRGSYRYFGINANTNSEQIKDLKAKLNKLESSKEDHKEEYIRILTELNTTELVSKYIENDEYWKIDYINSIMHESIRKNGLCKSK